MQNTITPVDVAKSSEVSTNYSKVFISKPKEKLNKSDSAEIRGRQAGGRSIALDSINSVIQHIGYEITPKQNKVEEKEDVEPKDGEARIFGSIQDKLCEAGIGVVSYWAVDRRDYYIFITLLFFSVKLPIIDKFIISATILYSVRKLTTVNQKK